MIPQLPKKQKKMIKVKILKNSKPHHKKLVVKIMILNKIVIKNNNQLLPLNLVKKKLILKKIAIKNPKLHHKKIVAKNHLLNLKKIAIKKLKPHHKKKMAKNHQQLLKKLMVIIMKVRTNIAHNNRLNLQKN